MSPTIRITANMTYISLDSMSAFGTDRNTNKDLKCRSFLVNIVDVQGYGRGFGMKSQKLTKHLNHQSQNVLAVWTESTDESPISTHKQAFRENTPLSKGIKQ